MASNYRSEGETLELTAPSGGVVSGVGYVIGELFVVALTTAAQTKSFRGRRTGKFVLPKADDVSGKDFAEGELVFWNDTGKEVDKTDAAYFPIGVASKAAASAATEIEVVLDGVATVVVGP